MKRIWIPLLVVAPLIFSSACSSDDVQAIIDEFVPPQGMLDQLDCLVLGLDDIGWTFDGLFDGLIPAIDGEDLTQPESADHNCQTGAFFAELDRIEEDGVLDIFLDGTTAEIDIPDETDLCDGLDVSEGFLATWDVELGTKAAPVGDGSGSFTVQWTNATRVDIGPGGATFDRVGGCKFELTAIAIWINPEDEDAYPGGWAEVSVNSGALIGLMQFDETPIASVSLRYAGTNYDFKINLDTGDPIFD